MNAFSLAWRNAFRQKRRTFVAVASLVVGMGAIVVFQGYVAQLMAGFRETTIDAGIGHRQIAARDDYFTEGEFNPFDFALPDDRTLVRTLERSPNVAAVFPSTGFTAIAGFGEKSTTLLIKAFAIDSVEWNTKNDPAKPKFRFSGLTEGRTIQGRDELILGTVAARILRAEVGDVVTLMAVLPNGGFEGRDFTVVGIYASAGLDKVFAYTDFQSAQDFLGQDSPPVLHVFFREDIPSTIGIDERYAVRDWTELAPFYVQVDSMFRQFLDVIRFILLLVTLFVLGNAMHRIVQERRTEWGTLRALGGTRSTLVSLVVFEGLFLGIVGATTGIVLGFVVCLVVNLAGGIAYVHQGATVMILLRPTDDSIWISIAAVAVTSAIASISPAWRAARWTPSECMRQVG